jgi:hypothetical protein
LQSRKRLCLRQVPAGHQQSNGCANGPGRLKRLFKLRDHLSIPQRTGLHLVHTLLSGNRARLPHVHLTD